MPAMAIQKEILDILKQKFLPELQEMKAWRADVNAELKVINGRLDAIEKRFEQVDKRFAEMDNRFDLVDKRFDQVQRRIEELHADLREVRSYVFTSKVHEATYQARERPTS